MGTFFIILAVGVIIWILFRNKTTDPSQDDLYENFHEKKRIAAQVRAARWEHCFTVYLAGIHVKGRKKYILNNGFEGYEVTLVPEPTNQVDPNAIKVVDPYQEVIGYIVADKTHLVHPILSKEHICTISKMDEKDSYSKPGQTHLKVYLEISYNETTSTNV